MTAPSGPPGTDTAAITGGFARIFAGATVLVTGGTRGIGRGIASRFLQAGADVFVCSRNEPEALPEADGRSARFVAADVRDPDQVDELVRTAVDATGRLDVLVNNAGGGPPSPAASASPRLHEGIVRLNLVAPLHCAQRANTAMQQQEAGGSIVNVGSVSGLRPSPGTAAYGASKAGLISMSASLAQEWAPRVRVNCISAGPVRTEDNELHYGGPAGVEAVNATVPLGRMCEPGDIADACLYLASPLARFVSGANLVLDGGGDRPAFLEAVEGALGGVG